LKPLRVLSLFDGISCGQVALERAGIPIEVYYASEIDKYAIQVTQKNYPSTVQLGDINNIDFTQFISKIDLIIGGSPCQDLSIAGKRAGLNGSRSGLFYKFVEAIKTIKPKYFLLENNHRMPNEAKEEITKQLGVEPILINSKCFSAQNRERLYWTNFYIKPIDNALRKTIKDILEEKVDEKYYMNYPLILKEPMGELIQIGNIPKEFLKDNERQRRVYSADSLSPSILARSDSPKIICVGSCEMKASQQTKRVYSINGLSPTLDTAQGGHRQVKILKNARIRKLTPLECERLQTLPDNYTEGISNTQRYKSIGNGWTVDVIAYIFKHLNT
jgi:DNA-cytosine methyltransferase